MTISRNLDGFLKIIAQPGATVVTSNTRAARSLRQAYSELQVAKGKSAWSSPDVLPWSAWLHRLWQEHIFHSPGEFNALLNKRQEQVLWERIIGGERSALDTTAVAAQCARAWKLLHAYLISRDSASFQRRADCAAFYRWSSNYIGICNRNGWTDDARVLDHLHKTAVGALRGRTLTLWGFDSFTPQQQLFLDAMASGGVPIRQLNMDSESIAPVRVELDDAT
jgi:hypothetical protein